MRGGTKLTCFKCGSTKTTTPFTNVIPEDNYIVNSGQNEYLFEHPSWLYLKMHAKRAASCSKGLRIKFDRLIISVF